MKRLLALGLAIGVAVSSSSYVFAANSEESSESIESLCAVDLNNNINQELNEIHYSVAQYLEKENDIRRTLNNIIAFPNEYISKGTILSYLKTVNESRTLLRKYSERLEYLMNFAVDTGLTEADTISTCLALNEQVNAAIKNSMETVQMIERVHEFLNDLFGESYENSFDY